MKPFAVKDKTVLITGASSGIGRSLAEVFAREGARVALTGRKESVLKSAVQEIERCFGKNGMRALAFPLDLCETGKIPGLVESVKKEMGPVDVLINNAGYAAAGLIEDCSPDHFRKNFEVNFFASLALIQAVLPGMKEKRSGMIINVSSGVGKRALPGFASYCTTKFALNGLTESLRMEVKPYGIHVLLVSPGRVSTDFHNRVEFYGRWKVELPETAIRSPEAIAEKVLTACKKRKREVTVWGPGLIGYHLNYWCPELVDWLLQKKYPVT